MLAIKTLAPKSVIFRRTVRLMGDQFEISVVGNNPDWADERIDDAIAEINRVEKLLSTFSDDSAVNEINRNAGISPIKTTAEIFRLINRSLEISALTFGAFDVTYYTAEKDTTDPDNTTKVAVKKSLSRVNYQSVVLDAKEQTVFLKEKGMRIGFGTNSRGYAADRAKYILQMQGVSSGVINAGGDLLAWGLQPNNEPWTIATADPSQKAHSFANVNISNMSVATSVNTQKYTAAISNKQLNTINPKKGFPVSGIKSVSIISPSAELADSMATPVMSMGINAGLYLINKLNQLACIIVDDHDRVYTSKDISLTN
ncbi:thiamine biosynthesis lipoprotein [Mucilaginibacter frigoritolerans]|uniref:FAD:protein FMN transferase n=1 Tax=Mucilaginibacter frigoritolerans TaxID=652788 RepID=A0A562U1G5_9SPHI|nr:FAD:protein FMN transferase [Mucilaginibacter frigoritolerans]TWI99418.1 thiamine biosynthesis lipoprotein [Mucilaginibacter frigoritolerans]